MTAGERLRLRPGDRPSKLVLERDGDQIGELNVGRGREVALTVGGVEHTLMTGEGWDVVLRGPDDAVVAEHDDRRLRDDRIVAAGREYALDLPDGDDEGELRDGREERVLRLQMRHPEHGSVLLADVEAEVDDLVAAFAATIAYLRCGSARRVKRFGQQHVQAPVSFGMYAAAVAMGSCDISGGDCH